MPKVSPEREPTFEEELEAIREGDTAIEVSAARAALRYRDFRTVWLGALSSSVGSWMQNVVLGAYAYRLTHSPVFVSVIYAAQLGPSLLLSIVGGALADVMDRRRLILLAQTEQLVASLVLTVVVAVGHPNKVVLVASVVGVGVGSALNAPAWAALVPSLVPREHLAGAMSLNATQINLPRVIGPAIGSLLYHSVGAPIVFGINSATYLFAIGAILAIRPRPQAALAGGPHGLARIAEGVRVARTDPLVRWVLVTISGFSLLCLPFVGQFPTVAARELGMDPKSAAYGLLYAIFGLGGVVGGLSIGTFLAGRNRFRMVQFGLALLSGLLLVFSLLSSPLLAFPVVALLGFGYFAVTTSLLTILQERLADDVRGRILALWQTGWAGMIPVGVLIAGLIAQWASIRVVLLYGGVAGGLLAWYSVRQEFG
jgi:MFS family permease